MPRDIKRFAKDVSLLWPEVFLLGFMASMAFIYIRFSGTRYFNFDEFEALYAGAALLRGKALFADQVEPHFPLFNICLSSLIGLFGFKAMLLLIARYVILLVHGVGLVFAYKIGEMLWGKRAGLLAVCLILSSIVFFTKGIEIRHDVFSTTLNVIGAYFVLRFIREKRAGHLIVSGIFLGMAFASTQKALVGNVGIIAGLWMYYIRGKSYKPLAKISSWYFMTLLAPLAISISYLVVYHGEDVYSFLNYGVATQLSFYAPYTEELYPFPYSRSELFKDLILQNPLLYALAIGGIFTNLLVWFRSNTERIVIVFWALTGVLFYVTAKRPFFQTLLPSIPPLSIIAAGFLSERFRQYKAIAISKRVGLGVVAISLLFVWPLCLVYGKVPDNPTMMRQMANVSYCVTNLVRNDKVLCFTQNQIFFDPLFTINYYEKRVNYIWECDADWFEHKMIREQCKVIINDYRTRLLSKEVKEKIGLNYIATKIGDILVPGFVIRPREVCTRKVWIAGDYYSPTRSLEVDGEKMTNNLIPLAQKEYTFHNITDRYVTVVYIFDKAGVLKQFPIQR